MWDGDSKQGVVESWVWRVPNKKDEVGRLAEDLVAQWLVGKGWSIVQQRWRCRWGELDLVMQTPASASSHPAVPPSLVFVEVKARSNGNWDNNGLLSITLQKQHKLWQAAELFLATLPDGFNQPCRFDVALVSCRKLPMQTGSPLTPIIQPGRPVYMNGYSLTLSHYIQNAFTEM
jgi:putative endonuclease